MILRLFDQKARLANYLGRMKSKAAMPYDMAKLPFKKSEIALAPATNLEKLDGLWAYHIFPPHIMHHCAEWTQEGRAMRVGDVIVQQVYLPGPRAILPKMIFGVRIVEIIDEGNRKGFAYETLRGHAERGLSRFLVEQVDGKCTFSIETWSAPANLLARWTAPLFAAPYQAYCTRCALAHLAETIQKK
jgi:hypothetical protein